MESTFSLLPQPRRILSKSSRAARALRMRTSVAVATAPRREPESGAVLCFTAAQVREATVAGVLLVKAYSCFIGAFFAVFVPQRCTQQVGDTIVNTDCTFAQNVYEDIDRLNLITLLVNLASAMSLLAGFYYEWRRERWIIEHLDVDYSKGENNLVKDIQGHETLRLQLTQYNLRYFRAFVLIGLLNIANVCLSIYFMTFWYADYRTATTFLTSFALLFRYLVNSLLVSQQSQAEVKALSVDLVEAIAFNAVGKRHRGEVKIKPLHEAASAVALAGAGAGVFAGGGGGGGASSAEVGAATAPPPPGYSSGSNDAVVGWGLAPPRTPRYAGSEV